MSMYIQMGQISKEGGLGPKIAFEPRTKVPKSNTRKKKKTVQIILCHQQRHA